MKLTIRNTKKRTVDAFTLIELLVVIAIIGVLMGLLFPALSAARHRARVTRAKMEMKQIETAWISYRNDYRHFPPGNLFQAVGPRAGYMNQNAVNILGGRSVAVGSAIYNRRMIGYMEFPIAMTQLEDPWGGVYRFSLASWSPQDPLNEVWFAKTWAPGFEILPRPVAVFSTGYDPTGIPVKSWE